MHIISSVFLEPTSYQRIVGIIGGLILIIYTFRLLHKFHIKENFAIIWLIGGSVLIISSLYLPLMKILSLMIGTGTPATTFFIMSIFFLLLQNLHLSVALSRQKKQIETLAVKYTLDKEKSPKTG